MIWQSGENRYHTYKFNNSFSCSIQTQQLARIGHMSSTEEQRKKEKVFTFRIAFLFWAHVSTPIYENVFKLVAFIKFMDTGYK